MGNNVCYSLDEEWFQPGDLVDAVGDFIETWNPPNGSEFTVYLGTSLKPLLEDVVSCDWIVENALDYVFGNYGELAAECFSDAFSVDQEKDLVAHIEEAVKQWRIKNDFDVNFFDVGGIREIKVTLIDKESVTFMTESVYKLRENKGMNGYE